MSKYTFIDLPFHHFSDGNPVFVSSNSGFGPDFGKSSPAKDRNRQSYFHNRLESLAQHLGTRTLPVFVEWNTGERTRMDKGCVGHAIAAKKIKNFECDAVGIVTHVTLGSN